MSILEWNKSKVFVTGMENKLDNLSTVRPTLGKNSNGRYKTKYKEASIS